MTAFSRSEKTFLISSVIVALVFITIARFQFIGIEQGSNISPIIPTVALTISVVWLMWVLYTALHRLATYKR